MRCHHGRFGGRGLGVPLQVTEGLTPGYTPFCANWQLAFFVTVTWLVTCKTDHTSASTDLAILGELISLVASATSFSDAKPVPTSALSTYRANPFSWAYEQLHVINLSGPTLVLEQCHSNRASHCLLTLCHAMLIIIDRFHLFSTL